MQGCSTTTDEDPEVTSGPQSNTSTAIPASLPQLHTRPAPQALSGATLASVEQSHITPASATPLCASPALLPQLTSSPFHQPQSPSYLALCTQLHSTQTSGEQSARRPGASTQVSESDGTLDFTDAGTPTVQFRQRRSLSLVSLNLLLLNTKCIKSLLCD